MSAPEPAAVDHALLQRVEIFSDVVLGFCLAELGLSLSLPVDKGHIIDVLTKPWGLVAFVWTFGTICLLWVRNNHLFKHYFIPNSFSIALNFGQLGAAVLMVYMVQVLLRAIRLDGPNDIKNGLAMYFGSFVLLQLLLGALFLYGVNRRWALLDGPLRARGVTATMRLFVSAIAMAGIGYGGAHGPRIFAITVLIFFPFLILAGRVGPLILTHAMGLRRPAGSSE
ncbi:MAG TPA: TMEM175 family protein [Candidatus Baltobacteraceae bacterium]